MPATAADEAMLRAASRHHGASGCGTGRPVSTRSVRSESASLKGLATMPPASSTST